MRYDYLVGGWPTPLKNMTSSSTTSPNTHPPFLPIQSSNIGHIGHTLLTLFCHLSCTTIHSLWCCLFALPDVWHSFALSTKLVTYIILDNQSILDITKCNIYIYTRIISCHGRCRAPGCFVVFCFLSFFCFCLMMGWGGVGWGGMLTFMFMLRWWCYVDHGVGCGGMLTFMFMSRWNSSMVEVVFEKWRNRRARLHAQLHWEVHATPFKTTRRLSAPFPISSIR